MCMCVNIFVCMVCGLLSWTISLSLFLSLDMGYLSLSLSLSFEYLDLHVSNSLSFIYIYTSDLHVSNSLLISSCFLEHGIYFFLHSPCPLSWNDNLERVVMNNMEFYLWDDMFGWMKCSCATSYVWITWSWSWEYEMYLTRWGRSHSHKLSMGAP